MHPQEDRLKRSDPLPIPRAADSMRSDAIIELKIGQGAPPTVDVALKSVLDRALTLIEHVLLAVEDAGSRADLTARLKEFRGGLESASDVQDLSILTSSCFDVCEQALGALQMQQAERRSELRRLVTHVRDAVATLAGDGDAFSSHVVQAAGRFNSLLQVNDVQQLKQRLVAEVVDLQRVAAERQELWHRTVGTFEKRIVALEQQLVEVRQEASLDPLTGISNRRVFEQAVREALASSGREFIVAVLDLDNFKDVNDIGGHPVGDHVLKAVAQTLRTSVRKHDVVARIGGDEFALLGVGASLRGTEARLRTLIAALGEVRTGLESPATVSASCGMAEYCAGDTFESLLRRADQALYEAKRQGKRRLVVKSPPFIRDLLHRKH
jgi:diguanylate cyclase (GGDEF)-like protein